MVKRDFLTPENAFLLLQSKMVAGFTLLSPTLGIAYGDLRFVCSCSALETHFMKLPTNSYCAGVATWQQRVRQKELNPLISRGVRIFLYIQCSVYKTTVVDLYVCISDIFLYI